MTGISGVSQIMCPGSAGAHWTIKVKGIGSGHRRAVGTVQELTQKAKAMGQQWFVAWVWRD